MHNKSKNFKFPTSNSVEFLHNANVERKLRGENVEWWRWERGKKQRKNESYSREKLFRVCVIHAYCIRNIFECYDFDVEAHPSLNLIGFIRKMGSFSAVFPFHLFFFSIQNKVSGFERAAIPLHFIVQWRFCISILFVS